MIPYVLFDLPNLRMSCRTCEMCVPLPPLDAPAWKWPPGPDRMPAMRRRAENGGRQIIMPAAIEQMVAYRRHHGHGEVPADVQAAVAAGLPPDEEWPVGTPERALSEVSVRIIAPGRQREMAELIEVLRKAQDDQAVRGLLWRLEDLSVIQVMVPRC